ncbi:bifunctional adenosylcobinamide kinase/adenosylcobinamide-phosphate guanylyltransferase [Candidatus Marinarcus aquaticus]|uniref:Adenosylcobinamide kinase n=1 Tax=Candidatus Marinarcus aquaticus TaxID=2044504 RepID=A0A4Q0XMM1_9BACT|nr:bifunctional adenosylcobinamide kinase/adenosylcobinamide-phosphate guanylyltransferase [Candidatus Marinarcus aquaticus]RXJ53775.1 cobinamide phosphate guanylyltransferase [Candidatus Marinarcus aquaticus]
MKLFYFGGQKSGKTSCASKRALQIADNKPYYIATYDNSFNDEAMQERIKKHQEERKEDFICIEESHDLAKVIKEGNTYVVDCMTMYLLNHMQNNFEELLEQLNALFSIECNVIFILNDINSGVIPLEKQSREFVDKSGLLGQFLAQQCDEVIEVKYTIERRLK